MMKRKLLGLTLIICMALASAAVGAIPALAASIGMTINSKNIDFAGQPPFIDSATGRTMIPLRIAAESLGAQVAWDGGTNSAVIEKNGKTITMQVGSKNPMVNGVTKSLDAPAMLVNGKVFVPVRFISEAMGCQVEWDEDNSCVNITTDEPIVTPPPPQATPDGMLPNEDKIQKELTQEDIQRLRSYSVNPKVKAELDTWPAEKQAQYGKYIFNESVLPPYLKAIEILQSDLYAIDYQKFENPTYCREYKVKCYSISQKLDSNEVILNKYIADSIQNKLKIKTYLVTSKDVICQASSYTSVRAKYFFYQSSGSKIEEPGSTLGKWYWQDIEFLFIVPWGECEGNTVGVVWDSTRNLNSPQPCNF